MIVKMLRYDLVLLKQQSEDFIERLRELGLVDITTTGWEPQEKDRQLLVEIDQYQKALVYRAFRHERNHKIRLPSQIPNS